MHIPVMVAEAVEWLAVRPGGIYVDATVGAGGHARAILERLTSEPLTMGRLIALDKDPAAITLARSNLSAWQDRVSFFHQDFSQLSFLLQQLGERSVDGIVADLGFSQLQIDAPERGFSFQAEGPLDMRMNPSETLTADEIVNRYDERELANVIYEYGEERRSQRIARAIVRARPIRNTLQLAELIAACLGGRRTASRPAYRRKRGPAGSRARTIQTHIHPATRTFQALRIAVNHELDSLDQFLRGIPGCLSAGGRLVVISFHSLEDRIVKQQFQSWQRQGVMRTLTRHVVRPSAAEVMRNRRSRSARLRAAEKSEPQP